MISPLICGAGFVDMTNVHGMCAAPSTSAAVMVKVAIPASAWLGAPESVRVAPSRESHAGSSARLYVKFVAAGSNVDEES